MLVLGKSGPIGRPGWRCSAHGFLGSDERTEFVAEYELFLGHGTVGNHLLGPLESNPRWLDAEVLCECLLHCFQGGNTAAVVRVDDLQLLHEADDVTDVSDSLALHELVEFGWLHSLQDIER